MSKQADPPTNDVVLVYKRTDDGEGACVLRARQGRIETGEVRALRDGVPITGAEVVRLRARAESPRLFDVDVQFDARGVCAHSGPPRVTSRAYRENYDAIFGARGDTEDKSLN